MAKGLTKPQKKALKVIERYFDKHGEAPTYKQISAQMGYSSDNAAFEVCQALEKKGFIDIVRGTARGIRV